MASEIQEARNRFIQAWGSFGSSWGVNRTMAQIHALLLVAPTALSAEEIMDELQISRGNVNMNVRDLIDWGLVKKELRLGERKEFFVAEKDIWKVARLITEQRKKRELDPMMNLLSELNAVQTKPKTEEEKAFMTMIGEINKFATQANSTLEKVMRSDENWFFSTLLKLFR